jgi:hypothetical protein
MTVVACSVDDSDGNTLRKWLAAGQDAVTQRRSDANADAAVDAMPGEPDAAQLCGENVPAGQLVIGASRCAASLVS